MAKKRSDGNADTNAVNETSNAAKKERGSPSDRGERGEIDHRHPRADEESLKKSEHYVSLKEIKEDGAKNGVKPHKSEKGAEETGPTVNKSGKSEKKEKAPKKADKKERKLNDKKRPEPTPELEKKDPGAREV